ncbi:MAG: proton-conducting transporter membrane subunit [Candidatus Hydrothermarchaeales archaeon]
MTPMEISITPALAVFVPLLGSLFLYPLGRRSERLRDALAVAICLASFVLVASMYPVISGGGVVGYDLGSLMIFGIGFWVDGTGFLFALVTSFVWLLVAVYSISYMTHEHARDRYYAFFVLTLAADLGVLLTGDLFSLFIFFELLTLSSWVLVVHTETPAAMRAGRKYLFMGIGGGLSLLFGIVLIYIYTGSLALVPLAEELAFLGSWRYAIAGLMVLGFGVKAGMFPVHIWLPEAHPVAPSPASALLSGVMIKAGAYGIVRVVNMMFTPSIGAFSLSGAWDATSVIGYWMIWIGIVTMFFAVCMALLQENSKRMLAYHSISQMGYILMGIGVGAYLGYGGVIGFAGGVYHIINHALFKALLFLGVGAVYYRTKELNMYKLGGLWRDMPFTFLVMVIAAAGIVGVPGFNGYASKTILHDAIIEAKEASSVVIPLLGMNSLHLAELIFVVTGGGTAASFIKLVTFTFLGKKDERFGEVRDAPLPMKIAMGGLASVILLLGVLPNLLVDRFLIPAASAYTYGGVFVEELAYIDVWTVHSLLGIGVSLFIGALVYALGIKQGWFHIHLPSWLGVDYWYGRTAGALVGLCMGPFTSFDRVIDNAYVGSGRKMMRVAVPATEFDRVIDEAYVGTGKRLVEAAAPATEFDRMIDKGYVKTGEKLVDAVGPPGKSGMLYLYIKRGRKFIEIAKSPMTRFDSIDDLYIKRGKEFIKVSSLPKDIQDRILGVKVRFKYLREPVSIFDQNAEDFFREIGEDVITVAKYPYAMLSYPFDLLFGEEEIPGFQNRAAEFEQKSRKLLYETPNISGISIAVIIMATMLTIYLLTALGTM